jgi:hypothetical protein
VRTQGHLWAIGYEDTDGAAQLSDRITGLATEGSLFLVDSAVAVRWDDGVVTLDGESFAGAPHPRGGAACSRASRLPRHH